MKKSAPKHALPRGYQLAAYRLIDVLGMGGFGVTYLAEHATLGLKVAIKEYLPNELAVREGPTVHPKSEADEDDFRWGLSRFLDEAQTLAKFAHRNVVRVRDYFESNSTAYIVMDYEEGESLDRLLARHKTLSESQLRGVLLPIVDGLNEVHRAGFLHRDIKPSNIYVRRSDESPVLLDFGAARQALGSKSKSLTAVASAGYSPPEQYESEGEHGAWTDIYSLSALCYRAITGKPPVEAPRRINRLAQGQPDPLKKLAGATVKGYSKTFLEAVEQGLEVIPSKRPGSLHAWVPSLDGVSTGSIKSGRPDLVKAILRRIDLQRLAVRLRNLQWLQVKWGNLPRLKAKVGELWGLLAKLDDPRRWAIGLGIAAALVLVALVVFFSNQEQPQPGTELTAAAGTDQALDPTAAVGATPSQLPPIAEPETLPASAALTLFGGNAILVVDTEPPGVEVLIGDQVLGETPLERTDMRSGAYSVLLQHPDYEPLLLDDVSLVDNEVRRISEKLTPGTGKLTVFAEPENIWIERDGVREHKRTPVTLEGLPAGKVELTLGAEEHRSERIEVVIPKGGVETLRRALERIPFGTLTLELDPPNAQVILPEIEPPYSPGMRLREGSYRVLVRREGYQEVTREIRVSGDTRQRIAMGVDPQPFTVIVTPAGAQVEIDGIPGPYRAGVPLEAGKYMVRVNAPDHFPEEVSVTHGSTPTSTPIALRPYPEFTVLTKPSSAMVELVDAKKSYRAGMLLEPGNYQVRVGAPKHNPRSVTINHGQEPTKYTVTLESFPGFTVLATPSRATIEIDNVSDPYRADMPLEPGEYLVRVSAPGYLPDRQTVRHDDAPTQHVVRLLRPTDEDFADELSSGSKGPEMVVIPGGRFRMGCVTGRDCEENEEPVHYVEIASFALSKYEVTFEQWGACVMKGGCNVYRPENEGWGRGDRPVIHVSWDDAQAYVTWLSEETSEDYRLPTEAEWEYAARAGTATRYNWGNAIGSNQANCDNQEESGGCGDSWEKMTAPVGSFSANSFRLHDMHGNVWEWVQDCFHDNYREAPVDGSARDNPICASRVLRGGAWSTNPRTLRSAFRYWSSPGIRYEHIGFRVAQTLNR